MSRSKNRRVVITGLGCISPVGNTIADTWSAIVEGKSGIAQITKFDAQPFTTHFAGEVKGFNIEDYILGDEDLESLRSDPRFQRYEQMAEKEHKHKDN